MRLKRHLSYANVASTLGLVIATAGGTAALAADTNSVSSNSIKPYNVTARDLAGIRVVQVDGQFAAFAPCPRAERLLGGGGSSIPPAAVDVAVSRPGGNGWYVQQADGPNTLMSAYALCLKAKPGK
jgi:hypothetical protein